MGITCVSFGYVCNLYFIHNNTNIFIGFCSKSVHVMASMVLFENNDQNVTICVNTDDTVDLTLTGDADGWFGIGFDGTDMPDTYSIVASTDNSSQPLMLEYVLEHSSCSPPMTDQSISIVSDNTVNYIRTVSINRSRVGKSADYYTFPNTPTSIDIIYSFGACSEMVHICSMVNYMTIQLDFVAPETIL